MYICIYVYTYICIYVYMYICTTLDCYSVQAVPNLDPKPEPYLGASEDLVRRMLVMLVPETRSNSSEEFEGKWMGGRKLTGRCNASVFWHRITGSPGSTVLYA